MDAVFAGVAQNSLPAEISEWFEVPRGRGRLASEELVDIVLESVHRVPDTLGHEPSEVVLVVGPVAAAGEGAEEQEHEEEGADAGAPAASSLLPLFADDEAPDAERRVAPRARAPRDDSFVAVRVPLPDERRAAIEVHALHPLALAQLDHALRSELALRVEVLIARARRLLRRRAFVVVIVQAARVLSTTLHLVLPAEDAPVGLARRRGFHHS